MILSSVIGTVLGLIAGFPRAHEPDHHASRRRDHVLPSLLIAVIVLYVLAPRSSNLQCWCSPSPAFRSICAPRRAEVLEIRERMFVQAAGSMGASSKRILLPPHPAGRAGRR